MCKAVPFGIDFDLPQTEELIEKWMKSYHPESISAKILTKSLYTAMNYYKSRCVSKKDKLFYVENDKICWLLFDDTYEKLGVERREYLCYFEYPVSDFIYTLKNFHRVVESNDITAIFLYMELHNSYETAVSPAEHEKEYSEYLDKFLSGTHIAKNYTKETIEKLVLQIKKTVVF